MNISPIIPIGLLLTIMLSSRISPKPTMIAAAVITLAVLFYPLIRAVHIPPLCSWNW